jgi:hypothetical protein
VAHEFSPLKEAGWIYGWRERACINRARIENDSQFKRLAGDGGVAAQIL